MKVLHLGWVTDSLKTILALRHADIESIVVNTDPMHFFGKVPALQSSVALNLEREDVGFAFRKFEDLHSALINPDWEELQERIRLRQKDFLFDSQGFSRFVNVVLQEKRG